MRKLYNWIKSLKFAISLLIIIAIISSIGAIIPQERDGEFYIQKYGESLSTIFEFSGFTDVYHSLYFIILLTLLTLSLILCSVDRIPYLIKIFSQTEKKTTEKKLRDEDYFNRVEGNFHKDTIIDKFIDKGYRYKPTKNKDLLLFHKKIIDRLNFLIIHTGIITIILGGIVGWTLGEKTYITLFEGERAYLPNELAEDMILLAQSVEIIRDPNTGNILSYETMVELFEQDEMVTSELIYVNKPLKYKGMKFYQDSMGTGNGVGLVIEPITAVLDEFDNNPLLIERRNRMIPIVLNVNDGIIENNYKVYPVMGERQLISGCKFSIEITDVYSHFTRMMGFDTNKNPKENPAIKYKLYDGETFLFEGYAFENYPDISTMGDVDGISIQVQIRSRITLYNNEFIHSFILDEMFPLPLIDESATLTTDSGNDEIKLHLRGENIQLNKFTTKVIEHRGEDYLITYVGPIEGEYTGISVKKDPGNLFFYIGSVILSISAFIMFLGKYRRITIIVRPEELLIGATTRGSKKVLEGEIKSVLASIEGEK